MVGCQWVDDFEALSGFMLFWSYHDLNEDKNYETDFDRFESVKKGRGWTRKAISTNFLLGWGGTFSEKIFTVGFSMGIPLFLIRNWNNIKTMCDPTNSNPVFTELNYTRIIQYLRAVSILKPALFMPHSSDQNWRPFHSPTWFTLNDDY